MTGVLCSLPIIGAPTAPAPANPLTVSRSPASVSGSASTSTVATNSCTATASGGSSGYTYAWSRVSGNSGIAPTNPNSRTTSFSRTGCTAGTTYSATFKCAVTDSAGTVAYSSNVSVSITRTGGSTSTNSASIDDRTIYKKDNGSGATVSYTLDNDGSVYNQSGVALETWLDAGTAAGCEARATVTSGSITSGTTGSWLSLSSDRTWSLTGSGGDAASIQVQIRDASTGTVLDSAAISFTITELSGGGGNSTL